LALASGRVNSPLCGYFIMENTLRLTIELVWEDVDLEELAIIADNGQYRGAATVYFGRGDVGLMANALRGFPKSISQREMFSGGSEDGDNSFAQLVFYCTDDIGHTAIDVTLSECLFHQGRRSKRNRVELLMRFEPGALDMFCHELDAIARRSQTCAVLAGIAA
jgi:hypothetical protein